MSQIHSTANAMVGEIIEGCRVRWHEPVGKQGMARTLESVAVQRVSPKMVEWTRPKSGEVVRKRLSGTKLEIISPDGTDLVAAWRRAGTEVD